MSIKKLCSREVITITKSASLNKAANLMKKHNIGDIVVVESENDDKPVGILTDRDIVIRVCADEIDINNIYVCDIMSSDLLVLKQHQGINEAIDMMCAKGVRRAPIIDDHSKLCGIATVDDLLILIADELNSLAKLVRKQITD